MKSDEDKYKETTQTWNKIALLYEEKFMDLDLYNESYDAILAGLKKQNSKVLEIGCGPGNIAKYLLSKRPDLDFFGTDIAPNMVELAKRNNPKARFDVLDIRDINVLKTKFDAIICGFCLPYLAQEDGFKFIADCSELLKKDGILYLSFVEGEPEDSGFKTNKDGDRVFFNYYKLDALKSQLFASQLTVIQVQVVEFPRSAELTEKHTVVIACNN